MQYPHWIVFIVRTSWMQHEIVWKELWYVCIADCFLVYWPLKAAYGRANEARRVFRNIHHHISMRLEIRSNENLIVSQFMQSNPNWMTWNIMQLAQPIHSYTQWSKFVIVSSAEDTLLASFTTLGFSKAPIALH